MVLTLRANPDWRDDDQGWSAPPGVDDQANSWDFVGGASWLDPQPPISLGVGTGTGTMDVPTLTITAPLDGGNGFGIILLQALVDPPGFFGQAIFEPAGEGPYAGVEVSAGLFEYEWSSAAHEGTTINILAFSLEGGLPVGMGVTGVHQTGSAGFQVRASNEPVSFTVNLTGISDLQGGGTGVGTGTATKDLIDNIELAGDGFGVGLGEANIDLDDLDMDGNGTGLGTGVATLNVVFDFHGHGDGVGIGSATLDIDDISLEGAGVGVGTGTGIFDATADFVGLGLGVGEGLGLFGVIGEPFDLDGDGFGVGTGEGTLLVTVFEFEGAGLGVGAGFGTIQVLAELAATGLGVGFGLAAWRTGVYERGQATVSDDPYRPFRVGRDDLPSIVDLVQKRPAKAKVESNA